MNAAHWHLLVNHVSVFGVLFGVVALIASWLRKNEDLYLGSVGLFITSGLFSWIATETGEGAEEAVEHLPGVLESLIERHEEAAEFANGLVIALAAVALLSLVIKRFKPQMNRVTRLVLTLLAIVGFGALGYTAKLGGEIRHTEIRNEAVTAPAAAEAGEASEGTDDDD